MVSVGASTMRKPVIGTNPTADSRAPSDRSATTPAASSRAAERLIRGISAVSRETAMMP